MKIGIQILSVLVCAASVTASEPQKIIGIAKKAVILSKKFALPQSAYKLKMFQILNYTLAVDKSLPSCYQELLNERRPWADKLKEGTLDIQKTVTHLDPKWLLYLLINRLDIDPNARFIYSFAKASNELAAYRVRRDLCCYVGSLEPCEKSYESILQKVSAGEFEERLHSIERSTLDTMLIEEASSLARVFPNEVQGKRSDRISKL